MSDLQRAFERGFMKRADEWHFPPEKAREMLAYTHARLGARGFTPRQLGQEKKADFSPSFDTLMNGLYPNSGESLLDVADRLEPHITDSKHKTLHEVLEFGKHMGTHGIAPGLAGAGIGGLAGALSGNKGEKGRSARKGALIGGALGFGSGALSDAYHLGDNTRDDIVQSLQEEKDRLDEHARNASRNEQIAAIGDRERLNKNIDTMDKSFWYEYFFPPHIESKLR